MLPRKVSLKIATGIFLILFIPISFFWLLGNLSLNAYWILPNHLLVQLSQVIWVISGFVLTGVLYTQRERENEIEAAYQLAVVKLLGGFFLAQLLTTLFASGVFDFAYLIQTLVAIPFLFLLFTITDSDFVDIEFLRKPILYLQQRIIVRMVLSLAILIIVSLELVNYATIYIVKAELYNSRKAYFETKIVEVTAAMNKQISKTSDSLNEILQKATGEMSNYYIGFTLLNNFGQVAGLSKVILLTPKGEPQLVVTSQNLAFTYDVISGNRYESIITRTQKAGRTHGVDKEKSDFYISLAVQEKGKQPTGYLVAFFKSADYFKFLSDFAFERNGEIRLYAEDYAQVYSSSPSSSFREELHRDRYLEIREQDPATKLRIGIRQPELDAYSGLQQAQYNSFFFTTLSIVLFLLVAFLFLRIIESPIRKLQEGVRMIGRGNLDHEIILREKNEFYELAKAFNNMVVDLRKLQQEQLKKEQLLSITRMSVGLNHEINNPIASVLMGSQLIIKMTDQLEMLVSEELKPKLTGIKKTTEQIVAEARKVSKILVDIQNIHEPIIENYVDGIKMIKVKFD